MGILWAHGNCLGLELFLPWVMLWFSLMSVPVRRESPPSTTCSHGRGCAAPQPRRPQHLPQLEAALSRRLRVHEPHAAAWAALRHCAPCGHQGDQGPQGGAGVVQPVLPRHVHKQVVSSLPRGQGFPALRSLSSLQTPSLPVLLPVLTALPYGNTVPVYHLCEQVQ